MSSLLLGATLALAIALFVRIKGGPRMPTQTLKQLIEDGAVVLDVRTREEFASGAYPGALNIPVQELAQRIQEVPTGRHVVVYCAAGARAAMAVQALKAAGYPAVTNCGGLRDMPR